MSQKGPVKLKVFHGMVNPAGQAWECSRVLKEAGIESVAVAKRENFAGFQSDICLHLEKISSKLVKVLLLFGNFLWAAAKFNTFHFHFGDSLIPRNFDLPILAMLKKKMVMHCHGSEVRLKAVAERNNKYFKFIKYDLAIPKTDEEITKEMKGLAKFIDTAVVGDYELLPYAKLFFKKVKVVPRLVNLKKITPCYPSNLAKEPLIIHAPSSKGIKGTDYVMSAIKNLKKKYRFRFQIIQNAPHDQVLEFFKKSDIIIDELIIGAMGIVSLEGMASGKPVICYIEEGFKKHCPDLPIVNATIENLEEKIAFLLENPALREKIGKKGREYVERYHNEHAVAQKLINIYRNL